MGEHDRHLPRRHLNKAADPREATQAGLTEVARLQGEGTKRDAKAVRATREGKGRDYRAGRGKK